MNLRVFVRWTPLILCLGLISCGTPAFQQDDQGWVLVRYYTNEEKGISGVEPIDLGEEATIVQEFFPGSVEELGEAALESMDIEEFPESIGTYQGRSLTWSLYSFEAQIYDVGPFNVSVDMAVAESGANSYFVGLVVLPESYEENKEKYQATFFHTLYAFSPLE